ncbi:MAG: DUF1543 domain-containing protein [Candidatus Berkiella sp.]
MLHLYAVLLGGRAPGCHIELHDVVFVVGPSLEDCYPHLVNKWFGGLTKSLHIDSSVELKYVDGYEVVITQGPAKEYEQKLYFANFGGYQPGIFGEMHEVNFYVAPSRTDALARAKSELCVGAHLQHSDDHLVVDDIIAIDNLGPYAIELKPTTQACNLEIISHYRKLNLPHIIEKAEELKNEHAQV